MSSSNTFACFVRTLRSAHKFEDVLRGHASHSTPIGLKKFSLDVTRFVFDISVEKKKWHAPENPEKEGWHKRLREDVNKERHGPFFHRFSVGFIQQPSEGNAFRIAVGGCTTMGGVALWLRTAFPDRKVTRRKTKRRKKKQDKAKKSNTSPFTPTARKVTSFHPPSKDTKHICTRARRANDAWLLSLIPQSLRERAVMDLTNKRQSRTSTAKPHILEARLPFCLFLLFLSFWTCDPNLSFGDAI